MKRRGRSIILVSSLLALMAACQSGSFSRVQKEGNLYQITTEDQLKDPAYVARIEDFYESGEEGFFDGQENVQIYYKVFVQPDAESPAILISSGRTEAAIKYKEVIFDLYSNGYSVYISDHRGQGLSGRMTNDPEMGYIDNFQYYIDDLKYFYDNSLFAGNHPKKYLLAHSMGGAIGMTYLQQHPDDFDAAAFSSPMLGLRAGVCGGAKLLEKDEPTYGLGEGRYEDNDHTFAKNKLTGSEIRYHRMNEAFEKEPKAKLGGATYQWVVKSCQQFQYMNQHISDIQTPFILFSAQNEQIVSRRAHESFVEMAQGLNKSCEAYLIPDAQHELLLEKDKQRIETINHMLSFYSMN